jgi:hypothetical protein
MIGMEDQTRYEKQVEKWSEKDEKQDAKKRKPRKNKGLSVGEISVMARQEGLSYGQWVAKHEYGWR